MSNNFKILETNGHLALVDGVYQDKTISIRKPANGKLSRSEQVEIAQVLEAVDDSSLFSLELNHALKTPSLVKALSARPYNFLRTFDLKAVGKALDLTQDIGGVADYLSEHVNSIDSIKVNPDAAKFAQRRHAGKNNIITISEDLDKLNFAPGSYDLIVIGDLSKLNLDEAEFARYLALLKSSLSTTGVLVCSVINKNRMSKWYNPEDMAGGTDISFRDLYCKPTLGEDQHPELTQVELSDLRKTLHGANFAAIDVHATFSADGNCNNLFSADYLSTGLSPINHFYRMGSVTNPQINEYLLFKNIYDNNGRLIDYADKYLILAAANKQQIQQLYDNDFSHFPGDSRRGEWRTITTRARSAPMVEKQRTDSHLRSKSKLLTQNLSPQPFRKGRLLVEDWLLAILNDDEEQFGELIREYSDWLNELYQSDDFQKIAFDLLPFNIIVENKGGRRNLLPFDTEWQLNKKFSPRFVLFRALFWFAFENRSLLKHYAQRFNWPTIGVFVVNAMNSVSDINDITVMEDLEKFVKLEEKIHHKISNQFLKRAIQHSLIQPLFQVQSEDQQAIKLHAAWSSVDRPAIEHVSSNTHWATSSEPELIKIKLTPFDRSQALLSVSADCTSGAYELFSLKIVDQNNGTIWSAKSAKKINAAATIKRDLNSPKSFAVRSAEPPIKFDLGNVENIDQSHTLIVGISYLASHYSEQLLGVNLKSYLIDHDMLLRANKLNEYRADTEFQASRIDYLIDFNDELSKSNHELLERLHGQIVRNEELHGFLLMRPHTRAKRVFTRTLNNIIGRKPDETPVANDLAEEQQTKLRITGYLGQNQEDYGLWVAQHSLSEQNIIDATANIEAMAYKPTFSILVPIYNTDPEYLIPMIRSVQKQIYPHWQLCLVDDCSPKTYLRTILAHEAAQDERISIQLNDVNQGIALTTNDALAMAKGDYIALLDHDDELSIDALYENANVINQTPEVGLIYSDEDKMDMQGNREEPYFKPDYSPDLLHTNNYICHFTVMKKTIVDDIGGFREGLDGSQDHDIILRAAAQAEQVVHIPKILYHWRKIPGSTAVVYDSKSYAWEAGRKAVQDLLNDQEDGARVELGSLKGSYRVFREIKGNPLVSIVIPFKDKPELLDACLDSILNRTSYTNIEIIGVSNNSEQERTFERMEHYKKRDERIRFVEKNIPFNFSAICNYGAEQANGDYLVLLNNDIEITNPDWIERLLEHAQRPHIGAVGGKLLYPDGRIQHSGVVVGMVGAAGHPHKFFPDQHIGYHGRLHMVYNVTAVTGAMMMIHADKFKEVGGLDEENLAVAYNDIDLCLKLMDNGYSNLFTPYARATHHESISRGYEDTDEKMQRLLKEQNYFLTKWDDFLAAGDPYYNPNLSLKNEKFSLNFKD